MKKKNQKAKTVATIAIKPYKIDKGIKLTDPVQNTGLPGRTSITLQMLEVGDSFLVKDPLDAMRAEKQMRDFAGRERKSGGKREFSARRLKAGTRIWRTK